MSRPKVHLCNSEDPLKEGETLTAICGEAIPRSQFVFMWDDFEAFPGADVCTYQFQVRNPCRECRKIPPSERYIYGVRTREDGSDVG